MIGSIASWWLASTLLGLLALPIAYRVFNRLPDRGYAISRALGLLLAGYVYWLGASLHLVPAQLGGILAGMLALLALSLLAGKGCWVELWSWLRSQRRLVMMVEAVFVVAYLLWVFVRINNPEIAFTEKPMELAFMNGILRSGRFPPIDPWLSGYAISYYYFGYVLLAFLSHLTGVGAGAAFNLGNALWFALAVLGTYAVLYNLLALRKERSSLGLPLLGPLFVVISGNMTVLFEILHQRHLFWQGLGGPVPSSRFWSWLNLTRLVDPPVGEPSFIPTRFLWWWQSSRVIADVNLAGNHVEVIDEFPFFSFLLADNHPHLLALPFVLLAVLMVLQLFVARPEMEQRLATIEIKPERIVRGARWLGLALLAIALVVGLGERSADAGPGGVLVTILLTVIKWGLVAAVGGLFLWIMAGQLPVSLPPIAFWFTAWIFGALAFLNTWDLPIYLSLLLLVLAWHQRQEPFMALLKRMATTGFALLVAAILFYLPWYPSFQSQAGGILPNLVFPTRLVHFVIMFGTLLIPILGWLLVRLIQHWQKGDLRPLALVTLGAPLLLLLVSWLLAAIIFGALQGAPGTLQDVARGLGLSSEPAQLVRDLVSGILTRRLTTPWTALILALVLAIVVVLALRMLRSQPSESAQAVATDPMPFVLAMVFIGALLILGPEFLYLRDTFGTRMNTIFKFYFAAWILWGLSAAYVTSRLWPRSWLSWEPLKLLLLVPLLIGCLYPALSVWTKTESFNPSAGRALDGTVYLERNRPSDYRAVQWINSQLEPGVLAEAVGGSYSSAARIAAHTGFPTVLGWPGHELQWRGGSEEQGSRQEDIQRLYTTPDWVQAYEIVQRYDIEYVYIGALEQSTYGRVEQAKFLQFLDVIYNQDDVIIYAQPGVNRP